MDFKKMLGISIEAASAAGEAILAIYKTDFSDTVRYKEDNSPLTIADTAANNIICGILQEAYPDIPILSEESTNEIPQDAPYCWVVDPLDGTKEFINKNGQFTVNIALSQNHRAVLGAVAVPVTGTLFYAGRGTGAYKQSGGKTERIHVSEKTSDLIWVGSKSHASEQERDLIEAHRHLIRNTLSAGSSLKGTMVAEGKADVYYRFGLTCEWDTCAMQCVVEEAGGILRQMDGSEMLYNRKNHLNEKGFYIVNRTENIWV